MIEVLRRGGEEKEVIIPLSEEARKEPKIRVLSIASMTSLHFILDPEIHFGHGFRFAVPGQGGEHILYKIGGVRICEKGGPVPGYDEAPVARHMAGRDIRIGIDLGIGRGKATVWTCDLTHRYIDINGSYRS